ncbi:MAG: N-acetylmuramoyl-L-alanine amidase [Pseudomonadota bacterium]|nr:N-acetylmuramoyl-L-alanine amidase [Pseudomonadota bacterium]
MTSLRVGVYPNKTRVVIELTGPIKFRTFMLPKPYRVVVDMSEVTWSTNIKNLTFNGLVTGMRFGLFQPGTSRIVLDVNKPTLITKAFILYPNKKRGFYRLVLDIGKTNRKAFMDTYQRKLKKSGETRSPRKTIIFAAKSVRDKHNKPLIMIDPGHGGVDPGAIGRGGLWEKHIVFKFARELRRQLLLTRLFRVQLTRNKDIFLRLRDRVAIARRAGADLFVSVHADSIANARVRGTSVYTLSERASDREADALARKENMSDVIAGVDLKRRSNDVVNILIDLAQRDTMNQSAVFAKLLVEELRKGRRMLRKPQRFAGFAVLKAPDIPSVLIELGFLSNRQDEKLLRDPLVRRRLALSINRAIEKYFKKRFVQRP